MLRIPPEDRQGLVIVIYQVVDNAWWQYTWDEAELEIRYNPN